MATMIDTVLLPLLKVNVGISSAARDEYLKAVINSTVDELEKNYNISLDESDYHQVMFIVDYSAWKYRSRGEGIIPRNLQFRLHNLVIKNGGDSDG